MKTNWYKKAGTEEEEAKIEEELDYLYSEAAKKIVESGVITPFIKAQNEIDLTGKPISESIIESVKIKNDLYQELSDQLFHIIKDYFPHYSSEGNIQAARHLSTKSLHKKEVLDQSTIEESLRLAFDSEKGRSVQPYSDPSKRHLFKHLIKAPVDPFESFLDELMEDD